MKIFIRMEKNTRNVCQFFTSLKNLSFRLFFFFLIFSSSSYCYCIFLFVSWESFINESQMNVPTRENSCDEWNRNEMKGRSYGRSFNIWHSLCALTSLFIFKCKFMAFFALFVFVLWLHFYGMMWNRKVDEKKNTNEEGEKEEEENCMFAYSLYSLVQSQRKKCVDVKSWKVKYNKTFIFFFHDESCAFLISLH